MLFAADMEGIAPEKGSRAEKRAKVSRGGPVYARKGLPIKNFGMNNNTKAQEEGGGCEGKGVGGTEAVFGRLAHSSTPLILEILSPPLLYSGEWQHM